MELHGKHAKILAIECSTPNSSSLITADHQHVKGQLEVIHSREAQRGRAVPMGGHTALSVHQGQIFCRSNILCM